MLVKNMGSMQTGQTDRQSAANTHRVIPIVPLCLFFITIITTGDTDFPSGILPLPNPVPSSITNLRALPTPPLLTRNPTIVTPRSPGGHDEAHCQKKKLRCATRVSNVAARLFFAQLLSLWNIRNVEIIKFLGISGTRATERCNADPPRPSVRPYCPLVPIRTWTWTASAIVGTTFS
jgi:hypothetical protein